MIEVRLKEEAMKVEKVTPKADDKSVGKNEEIHSIIKLIQKINKPKKEEKKEQKEKKQIKEEKEESLEDTIDAEEITDSDIESGAYVAPKVPDYGRFLDYMKSLVGVDYSKLFSYLGQLKTNGSLAAGAYEAKFQRDALGEKDILTSEQVEDTYRKLLLNKMLGGGNDVNAADLEKFQYYRELNKVDMKLKLAYMQAFSVRFRAQAPAGYR